MNQAQFASLFKDALIKYKISRWDPCTNTCIAGDCTMGSGGCCPEVTTTPLISNPTATGNTPTNRFVTGPTGTVFYIDDQGRALALNTTASGALPIHSGFSPIPGSNSITLPFPPSSSYPTLVYRNGLRASNAEYIIIGTAITFMTPFSNSAGGTGNETVSVDFSV